MSANQPRATRDDDDFFEAPTLKRNIPAELLTKDRDKSGTRRAVSDTDLERFERRETRETLPAPPDPSLAEGAASLDADDKH
ncbi:MAG: hypothetical protein K0S65_401 [Labilithrix sp.]|nr:hypothetical protein [Labilithrix sp.]